MEFSPESSVPPSSFTHTMMSVADDVKVHHKQQFFNPVTPDISPPRPRQLGMDSLSSKYTGNDAFQTSQESFINTSSLTSVDIQEMEKVRQHLQSMLKTSRNFTESDDFDQIQSTTENEDQDNQDDQESVTSVDTAALIQKLLPNSSPVPLTEGELQFANGQMAVHTAQQRKSSSSAIITQPFERKVRFNPSVANDDKMLVSENSLLKEHLERERFRRKHCEQQIQQLHSKLLEVQQQLAVAVSTDRKKEVMIEQLDKTLAKVVEGWKKHEEEKIAMIEKLKKESHTSEQSHQRQQEMLLQFEKELSQAVEALTREQERAAQAEKDKHAELDKQKKEHEKLLHLLAEEKEKVQREVNHKEQLMIENEQIQQNFSNCQDALKKQNEKCEELQKKQERLEKDYKTSLEAQKENVEHERKSAKDAVSALASLQKDIQKLEMELDAAVREKESLKMDMNLMEARYDATKSKLETEKQADLERQLNSRLEEVREQMNKSEAELRETHRKQVQEINRKHKEELQQQLTNFHEELQKKEARIKATTTEYEERVTAAQEQIASLTNARQQLENQRTSLTARLQNMMKTHCEEALGLLSVTAGLDSHKLSPTISSVTQGPRTKKNSFSNMEDSSNVFSKWPKGNLNVGSELYSKTPLSSQHHYPPSIPKSYSYSDATTTEPTGRVLVYSQANSLSESGSSSVFQGPQIPSIGMDMTRRDVVSISSLGGESYISSGSEFQPLKTYDDTDERSSVISGLHDVQLDAGYSSMEPFGDHHSNVVSSNGSPGESSHTLLEQDLDNTLLETVSNTFPSVHHHNGHSQCPPSSSDDLKEKIISQETRQAELNHYVKLLLQRSPGEPVDVENANSSAPLIPIPRSGVGHEAPIKTEAFPSNLSQVSSAYSNPRYDTVSGSNSVTKDVTNMVVRTQPAFVKTKVPASFKEDISTDQHNPKSPKGLPYYQTSTQPYTPPRRDTETEPKQAPPSPPGALSPEQLGQLSRLLSMYSGDKTKLDQPLAEQLFTYLRNMRSNTRVLNHQQTTVTSHSYDGTKGQASELTNEQREQAISQHHSSSRARKTLDSQFAHKKQVQGQSQGSSVSGPPPHAPHRQDVHGRQQKPTRKQGPIVPGPPLRQENWSKPVIRSHDTKGEKRPGSGTKQAKSLVWR